MKPGELEIDLATNFFGPLRDSLKSRLRAVLINPNRDTWDKAYSIIIGGKKTLWQAVIAVDPTFPTIGPSETLDGRILEDWKRIPTSDLILKALRWATH